MATTTHASTVEKQRRKRALKFGLFVRAVLRDARSRGMTVQDIERVTKVSKSTFYRWRDGDWTLDPRPNQVWDFCTALGVPPDAAGRLLGWTSDDMVSSETSLPPPEGTLLRIQKILADPDLDPASKRVIHDLLQSVASVATFLRRHPATERQEEEQ